jgi:DNA-binding CsgD family transcriptional regulator
MSAIVKRAKTPMLVLGKDEDWPPLTREAILASCREGVCPFCARDSLTSIGGHIRHGHGVSADEVREHYGFKRGQAFATPDFIARCAELTREMMRDPKRRAATRALDHRSWQFPAHRPQTIEALRARDPSSLDGSRRWREEHREEAAAHLRKMQAASQAKLRELWADQDWLDDKQRRFVLTERKEMARRWQAGESVAELARSYDANERSISQILAEQGVIGEHGRRLRYHHYLLTAALESEIARRYLAGERRQALAVEFGCNPKHISHLAKQQRDLTPRELEVLRLLATDATQAQIAVQLHVTPKTVGSFASMIYHKLGVRGRAAAVSRAMELHLIEGTG